MGPRWHGTLRIALVALSVGLFYVGAHFAATALIDSQRARQIAEINEAALRRSEIAVDYGLATLDDLAKQTSLSCEDDVLQSVRLHLYQRWAVKDIRITRPDGSVMCSAYPETLEFDKVWPGRDEMMPSRDPAVRLFRVEQFLGPALGVLKDVHDAASLVAILTVNASLFDVMPQELREHSHVALELANGDAVAQYRALARRESLARLVEFAKASDRYPMRTTIRIEAAAYERWHRESYVPILALGLALGLGFGVLLANALIRPRSPVADLDRALAAREFKPYLQPVFNLRSGAITGCEVLARWVRSDGTVIPPSRFIPLAESSGRAELLTWQLMSATFSELHGLLSRDKSFRVAFNVVPRHLLDEGFVAELRRTVSDARISPRQIVLEITEREDLADLERAAAAVAQLREHGFKVAIDDVGIGHSGLSYIQRLGANTLKIDKFFIDSVTRDISAVTVIEMLVRLAGELKMGVIAEGLETQEQVAAVMACGVSEGQGYALAPPLPVEDFLELVAKQASANASAPPGDLHAWVA